jgi:hypothetical protein
MAHNLERRINSSTTVEKKNPATMSTEWSTIEKLKGKFVRRRVLPPQEVKEVLNLVVEIPPKHLKQQIIHIVFRLVWGDKHNKKYPMLVAILENMKKAGLVWEGGEKTMFDTKPVIGVEFEKGAVINAFFDFLAKYKDPTVVLKFVQAYEDFMETQPKPDPEEKSQKKKALPTTSTTTPPKRKTAAPAQEAAKKTRRVSPEQAKERALSGVASLAPLTLDPLQAQYDAQCVELQILKKQKEMLDTRNKILAAGKTDKSEETEDEEWTDGNQK